MRHIHTKPGLIDELGVTTMTRLLSGILSLSLLSFSALADIYSASDAMTRGDYETAVKEFTKLAEAGDDRAQANLGYMYYVGEGVPQDYKKAVLWYRKAAVQGNKDAQYNLAVSYAFGEGVKQDLTEAAIWYRRAGEQGHAVSQYSLGISYAYGEGVPQDQKEAARWFKKAAEQGYARAQVQLGSMYHTGEGVEQNYEEAVHWYRMAADRGDATAQYNLGTLYRSGKGVKQDYAQAKRWFRQSADQGYAAAQNELASLERAAGAHVATRTVQAQPELLPTEQADASPEQQVTEASSQKQSTPVKQEPVIKKDKVEAVTQKKDAIETGEKPLFSVDKKELLSLDKTELDIASPETKSEPETQDAVVAKVEKPEVKTETATKKEPQPTAAQPDSFPTNTPVTAASTPDDTSKTEKTKESGGFFSALGKIFSGDKKESENKTKLVQEQTIKPEPAPELKEEKLTEAKQANSIPVVVPKIEVAKSFDEVSSEVASKKPAPKPQIKEDVKETLTESKQANSVPAVIPEIETAKSFDEVSNEVAAKKTETEIQGKEEIVEKVETAKLDTSESSASNTDWSTPSNSTSDTEETPDKKESSGGLFSALGRLFSGNKKTEEQLEETSIKEKPAEPKQANTVPETVPEIEVAKSFETVSEEAKNSKKESIENEEPKTEAAITETSEADTAQNIDTQTNNEQEGKPGFFSAIGNIFKSKETTPESVDTNKQNDDVLIAKAEEKPAKVEEITTAQKAEADLSNYSVDAGRRALLTKDYDEAVKQFSTLAEAGDSEAQSYLGSLYYVGKGVKQDFKESYKWYKKSADQGNRDAQYSIGNMYLLGEGVEQDNKKAAEWYTLASNQGHIAAKNNLESLHKLEELNRQNQLKQESLAKQKPETVPEAIEEKTTEEINTSKDETTPAEVTTAEDTEKKPGLLGLLGGLFGAKPKTDMKQEPETEPIAETAPEVEPVVEETAVKTDIDNTVSENVATSNDATAKTEQETETKTDIALAQNSQPHSESPGFFKSLFGSDESDPTNLQMDESIPEPAKEIKEQEEVVKQPAEETKPIASDVVAEQPDETTTEPVADASDKEKTTEKSGGIFGFFGKMFSGDDKSKKETTSTENEQEIALAEPTIEQGENKAESIPVTDETINEAVSENEEINQLQPLAIQGDPNAQYKLGANYYSGKGVKQDYAQAALWYRRAAEQGNVDAQYSLGNMYLMGEGISQDDEQAAYWYALAADQGHASAKHNLENLQKTQIEKTPAVVETEEKSDQLIPLSNEPPAKNTTSSESGKAEYERGLAYAFGDGVAQNDRTAFNYFLEAAEKGYALAQYKVGVGYAYGEGVRQDYKKAAEWYRKAAEQGYTIAQRNLATMYLNGEGIEQDKVLALAWYQVVASGGNAMDMRRRDMLQKELTEVELSKSEELANQITARLNNNSSL